MFACFWNWAPSDCHIIILTSIYLEI